MNWTNLKEEYIHDPPKKPEGNSRWYAAPGGKRIARVKREDGELREGHFFFFFFYESERRKSMWAYFYTPEDGRVTLPMPQHHGQEPCRAEMS